MKSTKPIEKCVFTPTIVLGMLAAGMVFPESSAGRVFEFTVEPLTMNRIGLDQNDVNSGPNTFPVGARIVKRSAMDFENLQVTFVREDYRGKSGPDRNAETICTIKTGNHNDRCRGSSSRFLTGGFAVLNSVRTAKHSLDAMSTIAVNLRRSACEKAGI